MGTRTVGTIDEHVGRRIFRRRRLLGLTQAQLADSIGIRFQQIQKYECGLNRVTASRLFELSLALAVPPNYFYEGLPPSLVPVAPANDSGIDPDVLSHQETLELIRAYYNLEEGPRRRLLDLAISLHQEERRTNVPA